MKEIPRRDKLKIYSELLEALQAEGKEEKVVLTRVQVKLKVPFDRLKVYISELSELGLIQDHNSMKLTEKGKQYLVEYSNVIEFMTRMGIAYR